ncbi:MAG: hydantoinase/oxoprolinase family protein [Vicinamibacterales bacterium]
MGMRLGIDIGGTFTDFILVTESGGLQVWKCPSTPAAPEQAVFTGVRELAAQRGMDVRDFVAACEHIIHGTTIATNTVINRSGPKMGILHTAGFRDILYLRDGHKPERYNLQLQFPEPLIPRYLRLGVDERVLYTGEIARALDEDSVRAALAVFKAHGVESIAVCLMWSMVNSTHEQRIREIVDEEMPGAYVALSSEILPRIREYPRACATVLSAYVGPAIGDYLSKIAAFFRDNGYRKDLLIMQVTGGSARVTEIHNRPVLAIHSGPAAGPPASRFLAAAHRQDNAMLIEMGGTSFEVSMITGGEIPMSTDIELEGYPIGVAAVDVHSIGAGGGSIAWLDSGGMLHVGPHSAGAVPGPACYGQGGTRPTVTDANLVLGYLNPDNFLGGRMRLDRGAAERALESVGRTLGLNAVETAAAVYRIVNTEMVGAMRAVSVMRGVDPRGYTVIAGGGAGGTHAATIAEELGVRRVICPTVAGGLCAFGMLAADVTHTYLKTHPVNTKTLDIDDVNAIYRQMEDRARSELRGQGFADEDILLTRYADAKYPYQTHEIIVPIPGGTLTEDDRARMAASFHDTHERLYTYSLRDMAVDMNGWRLTATGKLPSLELEASSAGDADPSPALAGSRPVYLHEQEAFVDTRIFRGEALRPGMVVEGPAVIELPTTTLLLFSRHVLTVGPSGDLVIEIEPAPKVPVDLTADRMMLTA